MIGPRGETPGLDRVHRRLPRAARVDRPGARPPRRSRRVAPCPSSGSGKYAGAVPAILALLPGWRRTDSSPTPATSSSCAIGLSRAAIASALTLAVRSSERSCWLPQWGAVGRPRRRSPGLRCVRVKILGVLRGRPGAASKKSPGAVATAPRFLDEVRATSRPDSFSARGPGRAERLFRSSSAAFHVAPTTSSPRRCGRHRRRFSSTSTTRSSGDARALPADFVTPAGDALCCREPARGGGRSSSFVVVYDLGCLTLGRVAERMLTQTFPLWCASRAGTR